MRNRFVSRFALARAACLATLLLLTLPPSAVADDILPERSHQCFEPWWRALMDRAEEQVDGPLGLAPLRLMEPLITTAAEPDAVLERLDALRRDRRADPLVAAEIDALLIDWDRKRGRMESLAERLERLGVVRNYRLFGPFPTRDEALPAARGGGARGRVVEVAPDGSLPLERYLYPPADGFAVVAVTLDVDRRAEVAVRFGADDRAELWVDGSPRLRPAGRHDAVFDQHAVGLRLAPGRYRLAWLVEQDDGAWRLTARLTAPDGEAVPEAIRVRSEPVEKPGSEGSPGAEVIPARTLTGELEELARRRGSVRPHLALDRAWRQLPDRAHSEATELARQAAEDRPRDLEAAWLLAEVETDPSRSREALEGVLAAGRHDPAVVRSLAHYHLRYGQVEDSLRLVRRGLALCEEGDDPYLRAWQAALEDGAGFIEGAFARLSRIAADHPRQPLVLERLAAAAREIGLVATARDALADLLEINRLDDQARRSLIDLAVRAADEEKVSSLLEGGVEARPYDLAWRLRLARHHLMQGNPAEAREHVERARAIAPENPAVARVEGEVALAAGRTGAAAEAWRRALDRGGESFADLRSRLAALTGGDDSFGERWALSLDQARQRFDQVESELDGDPAFVVLHQLDAFRLESDGRATQFRQLLIGVRNPEQADAARSHSFTYSPTLQRASVLDARLVRRDGSVVVAARSERSLLPDPDIRMWYDTRVIQVGFPRLEQGDLLEIRYRIHDRGPTNALGTGYFGRLLPLGRSVPTLDAQVVVETPRELPVRHHAVRLADQVTARTEPAGELSRTVIDVAAVPGQPGAPAAPPAIERTPYLVLGTVESWEQLGSIYADLLRPQLRPTPELEGIVARLIDGAETRREVVERLYRWVLENTRYVALEFGIHAIKPYPTDLVLRRRHGDCKDKASLLVTMLEIAGIPSRVALVRTRDQGAIDTTVPVFDAFNHAIVHVPEQDLWLDGTVLHHGVDELPLPDRGTLALVVDTGGEADGSGSGRLLTTPKATASSSVLERSDSVRLERAGSAEVETRIRARGEAAARARARMRLADDPRAALRGHLERSTPELQVEQVTVQAIGLDDSPVRYGYTGRMPRFAQRTGDALSFRLAPELPSLPLRLPASDRDVPMWLPDPLSFSQRTVFELPDRARVAELPESAELESPWGRLAVDVRTRSGQVICKVEISFRGGRVEVADLERFGRFARNARQLLDQRILLEWP